MYPIRRRRGAALVDIVLALIVVGILIMIGNTWLERSADGYRVEAVAGRVAEVTAAAQLYVDRNKAAVRDAARSTPVILTVEDLKSAGTLAASFVDTNPYRQRHAVALRTINDAVEGLVYTFEGSAIPDGLLGRAALRIGTQGGFVPTTPLAGQADMIMGVAGGWASEVSAWSSSAAAAPSPGHVASAFSTRPGGTVTEWVSRNGDAGREANTMTTSLFMKGHDIIQIRNLHANRDAETKESISIGGFGDVGRNVQAGQDLVAGTAADDGSGNVVAGRLDVNGTPSSGDSLSVGGSLRARGPGETSSASTTDGVMEVGGKLTVGVEVQADKLVDLCTPGADPADPTCAKGYSSDPSGLTTTREIVAGRLDTATKVYGESLGVAGPADAKRRLGEYLEHKLLIVEGIDRTGTNVALAQCPTGYKLVGCSGARSKPLFDGCDERDCGYVGSAPVGGEGSSTCQTVVDGDTATNALVHAYCLSGVEEGKGEGTSGPQVLNCPDWAPGTYPDSCIWVPDTNKCPAWANGTPSNPAVYPNCVVNTCPPWAPGVYPACRAFAYDETNTAPQIRTIFTAGYVEKHQDPSRVGTYQNCNRTDILTNEKPFCTIAGSKENFVEEGKSVEARDQATGALTTQKCIVSTMPLDCSGKIPVDPTPTPTPPTPTPTPTPPTPTLASCTSPWGTTVPHGESIVAYAASTTAAGGSCQPQTRTCNNGTLSGSYTAQTCTASSCNINVGRACSRSCSWVDDAPAACGGMNCKYYPSGFYGGVQNWCVPNIYGRYRVSCTMHYNSTIQCDGSCPKPAGADICQ